MDFNVSDHIKLAVELTDKSAESLVQFSSFIKEQTLTEELKFASVAESDFSHVIEKEMEGLKVKLGMDLA